MTKILKPVCLIVILALLLWLGTVALAVPSEVEASAPFIVWVDNDYDSSTPTWGTTHFDNIQDGVDAVAEGGIVFVGKGTYEGGISIDKPLSLVGAGRDVVTVDCYEEWEWWHGYGFEVYADWVSISGFFITEGDWGEYYLMAYSTAAFLITNYMITGTGLKWDIHPIIPSGTTLLAITGGMEYTFITPTTT